jgi:hypothetical protein
MPDVSVEAFLIDDDNVEIDHAGEQQWSQTS